jgi:tRNA threonylcarbamoyladenosine biosynthesis protein TsaB
MIKLRSYTSEDFENLYQIDQQCYEPAIAYSRRELRNYLRFPGADCIVAEEGATMIGFCITAHRDSWGYIVTMDVLEAYRRRSVGSTLLAEAERRLALDGVREVALETAIDNAAGIGFWKRHGYRTQGIRKGYYPGGRNAYSMVKSISTQS